MSKEEPKNLCLTCTHCSGNRTNCYITGGGRMPGKKGECKYYEPVESAKEPEPPKEVEEQEPVQAEGWALLEISKLMEEEFNGKAKETPVENGGPAES
jgi:hypothetical protein